MASKGQKLKQWTKEEKLVLIKEVKKQEKSLTQIAHENGIKHEGLLWTWVDKYNKHGEKALDKKYKRNIPTKRKNMSKEEELELENLKLRIELERLKKGYIVKGVGQNKKYYGIDKKNTK
jgi:transposase